MSFVPLFIIVISNYMLSVFCIVWMLIKQGNKRIQLAETSEEYVYIVKCQAFNLECYNYSCNGNIGR